MWLVFLHGPPGCGKLTVGRELAELTGFRLFHNHLVVDLLNSVFEFGDAPFVELREQIWLDVFRHGCAAETSLIFTFAPERTVRPDFPERAAATVLGSGGRVLFVELSCPEPELERRLADPSRAGFGKLQSAERYRQLRDARSFEFPPLPADLRIDTGSLDARAAAEVISAELGVLG